MAREINEAELALHNKRGDLWVAIHGKVYDLTNFTDDHPGGDEVLYLTAGMDGSNNFEDVGHSPNARDLMAKYEIGDYVAGSTSSQVPTRSNLPKPTTPPSGNFPLLSIFLAGITIAIFLYKLYPFN